VIYLSVFIAALDILPEGLSCRGEIANFAIGRFLWQKFE